MTKPTPKVAKLLRRDTSGSPDGKNVWPMNVAKKPKTVKS
jgi:hypothetical protein